MKKIIVLNDFPIVPPNHGGKLRIYNVYKHLSKICDITYICFGNEQEIKENIITETFKEVRIPKSQLHKKVEAIAVKLLGISANDIIAMFFCRVNPEIKSELKKYLNDCDLIILSLPYMYPAVKNRASDKTLFYESHNIESFLKKSIFGKGALRNFFLEKVRKNEEEVIRRSSVIFATSCSDSDAFKKVFKVNNEKLHISQNGTDISSFEALYENDILIKKKVISKPVAIFIGSGHPPNVEAARIIVRLIAPAMKDLYFLICGSVCWGVKNESLTNNVGLAFEVTEEEKVELFRCSDVALNPMESGSGTNIKMLDYMAAGLPVITTSTGARGLDLDNTNSVICEISKFPEKIQEVLGNKKLYDTLSRNGRKLVVEKYDWRKIADGMAEIIMK